MRVRSRPVDLDGRLAALREAVDAGEGVVAAHDLAAARSLLDKAGDRLGHGIDHTVVALAGATGSGKSSLFNALAGAPISTVGVRRPTTAASHACVWGEGAAALLDWLDVPRRHRAGDDAALDGLVLLDVPDHDSTAADHRAEVDRVVALADLVVWVVDPQKYADAALHDGYLRPLAHHAGVLLVVLNHADRLTAEEVRACRADLGRLLADDGLAGVTVLATSARTGEGVDVLRDHLAQRVRDHRAALERLAADVERVGERLAAECAGTTTSRSVELGKRHRSRVVEALVGAAGVDAVTDAVAGSHRARAAAATGWPPTRWLRRLRPDPLRRLHLDRGTGTAARTSLPPPPAAALARVSTTVRDAVDGAAEGLPLSWAGAARRLAVERSGHVTDRLDRAVAATDLGAAETPRWWRAVGLLQWLFAAVSVVGGVWLTVLFAIAYLRLGDVGTPDVGPVPLPTAMLLGGVAAGVVTALAARRLAAVGARRRARRARRRLLDAVERVATDELFSPLHDLLDRQRRFCAAVARTR